jgi:integrase
VGKRRRKPPKYSLHKSSGHARVKLESEEIWLGEYGSPESLESYRRLIADWTAKVRDEGVEVVLPVPEPITLAKLCLAYLRHVKAYYPGRAGEPTAISQVVREVLADVDDKGEPMDRQEATKFGPLALKRVRDGWVRRGLARSQVNKMTARAKRIFQWGVSEELIPATVWEAVRSVESLREGRTEAPDRPKITPVKAAFVDATLPFCLPTIRRMIETQRLTGMRPGEICILRWEDIDRSADVWIVNFTKHKTAHHGHRGIRLIGPKAQPHLGEPAEKGIVFGHGKKHKPYRERSYRQAIYRACKRLAAEQLIQGGMTPLEAFRKIATDQRETGKRFDWWHPHQLRHTAGTAIRKKYGVEIAQVILGHATLDATEIYAERDVARAIKIVREIG